MSLVLARVAVVALISASGPPLGGLAIRAMGGASRLRPRHVLELAARDASIRVHGPVLRRPAMQERETESVPPLLINALLTTMPIKGVPLPQLALKRSAEGSMNVEPPPVVLLQAADCIAMPRWSSRQTTPVGTPRTRPGAAIQGPANRLRNGLGGSTTEFEGDAIRLGAKRARNCCGGSVAATGRRSG